VRLCGVLEPLKGEPWTWLWGETNPQDMWWSKPSRAGGTPRTERSVELGAPRVEWTPHVDVAKRERGNPHEVLLGEAVSLESFGSLKTPLRILEAESWLKRL